MLSVSVAIRLAGPSPSLPATVLAAALRRFREDQRAKQTEVGLLATAFHSPTLDFSLLISPVGSPIPAYRFALPRPIFSPSRSALDFSPRPFPESGFIIAKNPFSNIQPVASRLSSSRRSPSGLSSFRILAFRRPLPLPATDAHG
jgi:hypothetical protein